MLAECVNDQHRAAKQTQLNQIPNNDYYGLVTSLKTQFAPNIGYELYKSEKPLPPKIVELFEKVNNILNPAPNE
jgi:putative ATP-dependent endonuclease of OLD family